MPFKKIGPDKYTHKGRTYTEKQVKAYYATEGFSREPSKKRGKKRNRPMEGLHKAKP